VAYRRTITVLLMLPAGVAAYVLGVVAANRTNPSPPPSPQRVSEFSVDAAALDFGEVWEHKGFAHAVPVRNNTPAPAEVGFDVSCDCLGVEPKAVTIPPAEARTVRVLFDLTARESYQLGAAVREVRHAVSPRRADRPPGQAEPWVVRGRVRSRITLDTLRADFAETVIAGRPADPLRVGATLHVPADRVEAEVAAPQLIRPEVVRPDGGPAFSVLLHPAADIPEGRFATELTLFVVAGGERVAAAWLPVVGVVQPEVRPVPARVWLGSKPVGEAFETAITLQRPGPADRKAAVERVETDAPHVVVAPTPEPVGDGGLAYRVRVTVPGPGDHADTVRFVVRPHGKSPRTIETELNYRGEGPPPPPPPQGAKP
jgi:hypothetical protein